MQSIFTGIGCILIQINKSTISPVTLCSNVLVGFAEANKKFSEVGPKSGGTLWPSEKSAIES